MKERKVFWDALCSFDGYDLDAEIKELIRVIRKPRYLYRFRGVTNNSLDALRLNLLYYSSADHYDDPFDSYAYVDWNSVKREIALMLKDRANIIDFSKKIHSAFGFQMESVLSLIESKNNEWWIDYGYELIRIARQIVQSEEYSICFTEDELNEVLWLKYAQNHKGFVMGYDLKNDADFLCGKMDKCKNCSSYKIDSSLYPVCYSDEKYDATDFIKAILLSKAIECLPQDIRESEFAKLPNMVWQRERIGLIKKNCHKYDKEWRLILANEYKTSYSFRPVVSWRPSSVTIGYRMGKTERNLVVALAKEAGISQVFQCFINKKDELDKYKIEI